MIGKIIRNTNSTTKFTDLRGCMAGPIDRGSVVNRQPGFRQELVEQTILIPREFWILLHVGTINRYFLEK